MRLVSALSRVAFIANLAFLVCLLLQWRLFITNQSLLSTILVTGFFLAPFVFNPAANLSYAVLLVRKKKIGPFVPKWLRILNFIFLLLQLVFILFFLHDPFHS